MLATRTIVRRMIAFAVFIFWTIAALATDGVAPNGITSDSQTNVFPLWHEHISDGFDPFQVVIFVAPDLLAVSQYDGACGDKESVCGRILLFEARSGELTKTLYWSAPSTLPGFSTRPELAAIHKGRFLVKTANQVRLFSSEGKELKRRNFVLESRKAPYNPKVTFWDRWQLAVSPDGQTALLTAHRVDHEEAEEHWISVETLEDLEVEKADTAFCCSSVSHDSVVYRAVSPKQIAISLREKGGVAHPLCEECFGRDAIFLDDSHVFMTTWPRASFTVVSTGGQVEYKKAFGNFDDGIGQVSAAPLAGMVAFQWSPRHIPSGPMPYHVTIFDLASGRQLAEIQLSGRWRQNGPFISLKSPVIALAPDGSKLAILFESVLRVFSVGR